jgi:hypothetical protein
MKTITMPKAEPVKGEELQKLLAEVGVESLEELDEMQRRGEELPGALVIDGEDFESWDELIAEFKRRSLADGNSEQ